MMTLQPNVSGRSVGRIDASLPGQIATLRAQGTDDLLAVLATQAPSPQALVDELGPLLGLPVVRMQDLALWSGQFQALPFAEVAKRRCALLEGPGGDKHLLVTDPFDTDQLAWARTRFGDLTPCLASTDTFDAWLAHAEIGMSALGSVGLGSVEAGTTLALASAETLSLQRIGADDSPAVRFVNSTLYDALKTGASDIHLESDPAGLAVKFRIDGVLTAMRRVDSAELAAQAISRVKVMAQLDIAERRVPQDGRMQIAYKTRAIDVRVSIMPSIHGEDAVLRILDREHLAQSLAGLTLAKLGYDEASRTALHALCRKPHGMLLVTGPTGSGKTTTLYAAIAETHESRDKVITIEDPVEYQLPGVLQIPVNERKGLTFARGLRSILRHDPDKILVGEIRDAETAQIAVQSALTGHLVFTTVHANNVVDVLGRFLNMGVEPYNFVSALNCILAQRLVRVICGNCRRRVRYPDSYLEESGMDPNVWRERDFYEGAGCIECSGTGFRGRTAIHELLDLSDRIREMILDKRPASEIRRAAREEGMTFLREAAIAKVQAGVTTLKEINKVTFIEG